MKSLFEMNVDELGEYIKQGGGDCNLQGIEDHPNFSKLFRNRANPVLIAETLLKEQIARQPKVAAPRGGCQSPDSSENKASRLKLRELELELRKQRTEGVTQMQNLIYKKLQTIEDMLEVVIGNQARAKIDREDRTKPL